MVNPFSLQPREDANSIAQAAIGNGAPMMPEEIVAQLSHYYDLLAATRDPNDTKQAKKDDELYQSLAKRLATAADTAAVSAPGAMPLDGELPLDPNAMPPDMSAGAPPQVPSMQLPPGGIPNSTLGNPANVPFGNDPQIHAQSVIGQQSAPGQSPPQDSRMQAMREFLMRGRN